MNKLLIWIISIVLFIAPAYAQTIASAVDGENTHEQGLEDAKEAQWQDNLIREAHKWLNQSKEASEKSAEWVKEDVRRMGDWEYKIIRLNATDDEQLTMELNKFGAQRWEIYWLKEDEKGDNIRFFLKRKARTYMKHVPIGDMLRLIPKGEGE